MAGVSPLNEDLGCSAGSTRKSKGPASTAHHEALHVLLSAARGCGANSLCVQLDIRNDVGGRCCCRPSSQGKGELTEVGAWGKLGRGGRVCHSSFAPEMGLDSV